MRIFHVHHKVKEIRNSPVVLNWIEDLEPQTIKSYLMFLAEFSIVNNLNPDEMLEIARKEKQNPPLIPSIQKWFKKYEAHNVEYERSINTYNHRKTIIKGFFTLYQIPPPLETKKDRRKARKKFGRGNKRKGLTHEDIKRALDATWTQRMKAMILTQCSSGLAVADLVTLTVEEYKNGLVDVGEDRQICKLFFEEGRQKGHEYEGREFYTFLSFEAVDAINLYLETERKQGDLNPYIFTPHAKWRSKAVEPQGLQRDLRELNKRLKILPENKGEFAPITSHMFRKWFNTQLANTKMSYEARKTMMGHVISGVDDNYYLTHPDDLMKLYVEYMPVLLIYEYESVNITTTDEKVEEQDKRIKEQDEKMGELEEMVLKMQEQLLKKDKEKR